MDSDASEDHMVQDDFRQKSLKYTRTVDSTVSDSFKELLGSSQINRLKAATSIVKHLFSKQGDQSEELCHELSHALHRLIRGVGTPREDARIGFYSTLVSLLATFPQITVSKVLEVINKELVGGGALTKSEQAEEFTGQVLTYGAVIQSGSLKLASSKYQNVVLTNLTTAASKREYLPAHAYSFLIQFAESSPTTFKSVVWPVVSTCISVPWPRQTHHTLLLLLWVAQRHPGELDDRFCSARLEGGLTEQSTLEHCGRLLLTPPRHPMLAHPVYEAFCRHLVATNQVAAFFGQALDVVMAKRSGGTADMAVAKMVLFTAQHITHKRQVCGLLSQQVLQLLLSCDRRQRKTQDGIAETLDSATDAIVAALQGADDDDLVDAMLRLLKGSHGNQSTSGLPLARRLLPLLGESGVLRLLAFHREALESAPEPVANGKPETRPSGKPEKKRVGKGKGKRDKAAPGPSAQNGERAKAVRAYQQLLAHPALQKDQERRAQLAQPLIDLALVADIRVGLELATLAQAALLKTLEQRAPNLAALRSFLSALTALVHQAVFAPGATPRQQPTAPVAEAWGRMRKALKSLTLKNKVAAAPLFHTMFMHLGLLLLSDASTAIEALQELHCCLDRAKDGKRVGGRKSRLLEGAFEAEEPDWTEVAVELLLSLLSHPSLLLRKLVLCVFPHLIPHLTLSALHQILDVLDVSSELSLLRGEDESDSGSEEEEDEEEAGEEAEEEEEDEVLSSEGEGEPVNERLKVALRQALWPVGGDGADSEEEVEPTEEEGAKLDLALADAFREFRASKSSSKPLKQPRDEETLMHFRARVLDVLEAALTTSPPMSACLDAVPPLVSLLQRCVQDPHQKALENRVRVCLRKLSSVKTWRDAEGVTPTRLATLLHALLDKGARTAPLYLATLPDTTALATFTLRCAHHVGDCDGSDPAVTDRYLQALEEFMTRRECLHNVSLYTSALALPWRGNFALAKRCVDYAFAPIRLYRREQALALAADFLRNKALASSAGDQAQRNEIIGKLLVHSQKLLAETSMAPTSLKPKYVTALCEALRLALGKTPPSARWRKLGVALATFAQSVSGPARQAVAALARRLGASVEKAVPKPAPVATVGVGLKAVVAVAETNGTVHSDDEEEENAEAEKLKRKEARKLKRERKRERKQPAEEEADDGSEPRKLSKKESRQLRQSAMSEGLGDAVFSADMHLDREGEEGEATAVVVNGQTTEKRKKKKTKKRRHNEEEETREPKKTKFKNKT